MRCAIVSLLVMICACTFAQAKGGGEAATPRAQPHYRVGKAPKPEFKVGGKSYKIDPEAKSTKQARALPPEHFDPATRHQRVETFYREALKDHYEDTLHGARLDAGPFRHEFMHWARRWPAAMRARWAWHNRAYIDDALWTEWMVDPAFAAEVDSLQRQKLPAEVGYLPPEYAATSPVLVYNDEFLNAAYNPVPFLAVLTLKSLKPDEKTDWIGTAAAESIVSKLSSTPGLFLAERDQVMSALRDQKLREPDVAATQPAAQVGKALDVERVVVGSYVVDGDDVLFNLRIVDVQSGAVQTGISKTVPREHVLAAMPDLASSLADALGFQAQEEPPIATGGDRGAGAPTVGAAPVHTETVGGKSKSAAFEDLAPPNGVLVGFTCLIGKFSERTVIKSAEPIFMVTGKTTNGQYHGTNTGKAVSAVAKPGYAVAGLIAWGDDRVDGLTVIFMRRTGNQLDPKDSYRSDPLGGTGSKEHRIGGDGKLVIGIFGEAGKNLDSLGLVQAP